MWRRWARLDLSYCARMAATKISLRVPTPIEVGNVDIEFEVRNGAALVGTVKISRGGIDWRASGKRRDATVTWKQFSEIMSSSTRMEKSKTSKTKKVEPDKTSRRDTQQLPDSSDSKTIRTWAQQQGMQVNARGALPKSLRDAYLSAHA